MTGRGVGDVVAGVGTTAVVSWQANIMTVKNKKLKKVRFLMRLILATFGLFSISNS